MSGWANHGKEKWWVDNGALVCESGPKKNMDISQQIKRINFILDLDFNRKQTVIVGSLSAQISGEQILRDGR